MNTSILSSKGQIVIPKEVREKLGLGVGDKVQFVEESGGFKIVPATSDIRDVKGIVDKPERPVSIEQMKKAISTRAKRTLRGRR